eukprot:3995995-Amphidinium_carterae.1
MTGITSSVVWATRSLHWPWGAREATLWVAPTCIPHIQSFASSMTSRSSPPCGRANTGKYGQCRWGGLAHTCTLPPSTAGRTALTRLWAGLHPANRTQGMVWRPDLDAHWANADPLDLGLGQGPVPPRPSYRL